MFRVAWSLPLAFAVGFLAHPALASVDPGVTAAELRPFPEGSSARFVPGEVIVRFEAGTRARARAATLRRHGAEVDRGLRLPGVAVARVAPASSPRVVAAALEREPNVVYAEPNFVYQAAGLPPNDPRFAELWGLHNASDADIDAPEAWDRTTGSSTVTVAVVDTGVAYHHPDLAPNIWANAGETGNGVDEDGNGFVDDLRGWDFVDEDPVPLDYARHGTHVAGTIGARGNNGLGVAGVNWEVKLMPLRAGDGTGSFAVDAVARAFSYACAEGARVVNGSFGGPGFSQTLANAIGACPGTLFVFASGNGGVDGVGDDNDGAPTYPCAYTAANVICVAASGATDSLTTFSNYGASSVDLAAPGAAILSTMAAYDTVAADGFESDLAGRWTVGGTGAWARTTEARKSGAFSVTDSPGASYTNNASAWIATASAVDLGSRLGCAVEYELRLATELDFDGLLVEGRADGSSAWTAVAGWTGSTGGAFLPFVEDLSAFDGDAAFLRFRLVSDAINVADGAHVDDLRIACLRPGAVGGYESHGGTSMAAPHVAGVAALVLAANPGFSTAALRQAILGTVDRRAALTGKVATGGRLNAFNAVTGTATPPLPPPPPPPPPPPAATPPPPPPPPPAVRPDTVAPNTRITRGPARTTRVRRATFRFVSTEPGSTFRCRLDFGTWRSCRSPRVYRFLKRGRHTFRVRARDRAGNFDVTPAVRSWRVR